MDQSESKLKKLTVIIFFYKINMFLLNMNDKRIHESK
jgi:hypothetical protein